MNTTKKAAALIVAASLLVGCAEAQTISNTPLGVSPDSTLATGLKNAAYNLDQAIAIGVLPADDPAAACVHGVLKEAGLEATGAAPAQTFQPRVTDLLSAGSVAYIEAQRLKAARGLLDAVPVGCAALVGQITIDGVKSANSLVLPFGR